MIRPDEVYDPLENVTTEAEFEERLDEACERFLKQEFALGPEVDGCRQFTPSAYNIHERFTPARAMRFVKRWKKAGWRVRWDGSSIAYFYFTWPHSVWTRMKEWINDRRFA